MNGSIIFDGEQVKTWLKNANQYLTRIRLPQILAGWKIIRSEGGSPTTTPILLKGDLIYLGAATALEEDGGDNWGVPPSDLITFQKI